MGITNKKNKMSIELEANVDVEVEIDAGLEVEIEVQEEAVVEIEVDIEAPELAVECELALDVNVEENLVANEQGGSVEDLSAHGTQKIIWLVVMIVCMLDLLVTVPYLGWAVYAIIMVYGQSGFHGATAASCWITLIFVALFVAVGVIVLLISLKKWKQAKYGKPLNQDLSQLLLMNKLQLAWVKLVVNLKSSLTVKPKLRLNLVLQKLKSS